MGPGHARGDAQGAAAALPYTPTSVEEVADHAALDDLLLGYCGVIVRKLGAAGGPTHYTPQDLKASFWPNLHKVLPPNGRLILAHDPSGRLVGCGTLHKVRPDA